MRKKGKVSGKDMKGRKKCQVVYEKKKKRKGEKELKKKRAR